MAFYPGVYGYADAAPLWPYAEQMKTLGFSCKRSGHYRRFYDADGTLRAAFSYNACLYTTIEIDGETRMVINLTKYSMTTGGHQDSLLSELSGGTVWRYTFGLPLPMHMRRAMDFYGLPGTVSMQGLQDIAHNRLGTVRTLRVVA